LQERCRVRPTAADRGRCGCCNNQHGRAGNVLIDDRGSQQGIRIIDERLGYARAEVASARELTETQRTALNAQLERLTGKRIRMRFQVDESLIGGVVARIGSTVYDGSLRGQLASLESRLRAES